MVCDADIPRDPARSGDLHHRKPAPPGQRKKAIESRTDPAFLLNQVTCSALWNTRGVFANLEKPGMGARGGAPIPASRTYRAGPRLRPGFKNPLFFDAWQADGSARPWPMPMSNVVSRLLNRSSVPMHPDASIAAALCPLSQTLVGPLQHVLNIRVIPGNTELQSPGCGA